MCAHASELKATLKISFPSHSKTDELQEGKTLVPQSYS